MIFRKLLLFGLLAISTGVTGQRILAHPDSIPVSKPKFLKNMYALSQPVEQEITLKTRGPKAESELPGSFGGNLAGGLLTLITGISTSTSEEALWVMQNELVSTNESLSWRVPLYFQGEYTKTRERVSNDDGSTSVETQKGVVVDWSRGGSGFIIEKGDTIGWFNVDTSPESDSIAPYWLERLYEDGHNEAIKLEKYQDPGWSYNILVNGQINGLDFFMITNNDLFRSVIMINGVPTAIFQREPNFVILKKKNRVYPYLLFNKGLEEDTKLDLVRLGILNSLLSGLVSTDFYGN